MPLQMRCTSQSVQSRLSTRLLTHRVQRLRLPAVYRSPRPPTDEPVNKGVTQTAGYCSAYTWAETLTETLYEANKAAMRGQLDYYPPTCTP